MRESSFDFTVMVLLRRQSLVLLIRHSNVAVRKC